MILQSAQNLLNRTLSSFWWLLSLPLRLAGFFSAPNHQYPNDEAGVLMDRYMAHQSWLDGLSHSWFKKSFFSKTIFFLGTTLASAWIGLLAGTATLFVLTTGLFLAVTHTLLGSHEKHRRAGAELFAKEILFLNKELTSCKELMKKACIEAQTATEKLNQLSDSVTIQIERLNAQTNSIEQHNKPLGEAVSSATKETATLIEQERLVSNGLDAMSAALKDCDQAIAQSTGKITTASESIEKWSTIVEATLQNQKKLSQATNRFFLLVSEQANTKPPLPATTNYDYINQRKAENDDDERLIALWRPMLRV